MLSCSRAEDSGPASDPFSATTTSAGFDNELAVQYDEVVFEVAIPTETGKSKLIEDED